MGKKRLPTPRIQFRWEKLEKPTDSGMTWKCNYELVIGLGKTDIRNPFEFKKKGELVLPLSGGTLTDFQEGRTPVWPDGRIDSPFRDGAHAIWDGDQLGHPPIVVVYGDHVYIKKYKDGKYYDS